MRLRRVAKLDVVPLLVFLCLLVWSCSLTLRCQAQPLDPHEVGVMKSIGLKLGKHWDFTVDPCKETHAWVDPNSSKDVAVNITCGACNSTYCHVISFILKSQNLTGSLPEEFSELTFLELIDLSRNYLNGTIPTAWASLRLTTLALFGNRITGKIPDELSNITTLQYITLENNLMQGPIPKSLGKLINLERLHLPANNFMGELPESLGNLKNMTDFRIDGNSITGEIPSFIGNWTKLQRLDMQGTNLEGPFPSIFSTLENLTELRVSDLKGGDGKFPPLQNMKEMKELVLRNLSISGELPEYIGNMTNLKLLDLSFNKFTGPIPDKFSSLKNHMDFMYLANNQLSGTIPDWILTSTKHHSDLSYNNFSSFSAPGSCPNIGTVNLVSSFSSSNSKLVAPCLRRNYPCPAKAKNYKLLINCGGGTTTIGNDEYHADTDTQGASYFNSFGDKWAFSSTGDFVGNDDQPYIATNISVLNIRNPELYMTARLNPLSLKYYGLCLQNGNYKVDLHFAEIMFTDDQTYFSLGRRLFDVSIQGKKVLRDFNIAKEANGTGRAIVKSFNANVTGNTLEIHFQWAGKGTNAIPHRSVYGPLISAIAVTPNFEPDTGESELSKVAILGIVVASCVVIALISVFIWSCWRRNNNKNSELRGLELQTGYFTLRQIKAATKNFDATNKLGEGGFGPVYKGVLPDGTVVAVKQLSSKSRQGNREFVNEIGMISALQHPNLVKLVGCCIEGNQLLLIYEYMENNSLGNALFSHHRDQVKLDWQTRHKICLGIARGLAYLHEESRLKIVHRDIKASNVLLDKDLNAKISDFGLARLSGEDETHISTRIAGTVGYMAPEYAMRGYLTDKADVYSFGVVTLEVVSGMSNTNYRPNEDCVCLLDWAYVLQEQGDLLELVDKRLGPYYSEEEALQMLNLALTCTNPSSSLRPTMSTVVSILDGKNPVPSLLSMNSTASISNDSESPGIFIERPWIDSSVSVENSQEENTRISLRSKLIYDQPE
ncbi:putative protein kinase RLK-Pelle-DLSV family [Dioscorea sansibarensis]